MGLADHRRQATQRQRPMSMTDGAHVTSTEKYVLAGFVVGWPWRPPLDDRLLPAAVMTVSECLSDFLPPDQDPLTAPWHVSLSSAAAAARQPESDAVQILAAHVPAVDRDAVLALFHRRMPDRAHPVPLNLTAMAAPTGEPRGFEVVGFEAGRFHSWLCYGYTNGLPRISQPHRPDPVAVLKPSCWRSGRRPR